MFRTANTIKLYYNWKHASEAADLIDMKTHYFHQITQSARWCLVCLYARALHPHPQRKIPSLQRDSDTGRIHMVSCGQVVLDQTPEQETHRERLGTPSVWQSTGRDRERRKEEGTEPSAWKATTPPVTVWFRDEDGEWKQQEREKQRKTLILVNTGVHQREEIE